MALIYFGDNRQRQELHSCLWQTNLENTQKTILGKILKRALFDLNETYEIRYEFKTLYRKIE